MPQFSLHTDTDFVLFLAVGLFLAAIWIIEFIKLMGAEDSAFPGQFVRFGWVAAFLVLWMLAPLAFIYWRRSRAKVSVRTARSKRHSSANRPPEVVDDETEQE